jgi:hypothetical protein
VDVLNNLTIQQLLWLIPILFALHNMEEAPGMARWTKKLASRRIRPVSTPQFVIAVSLLTAVVLVFTLLAVFDNNGLWLVCVLEFQAIILLNAFVPHLLLFVRFRQYNPGLITAVLLNTPFSIYLFQRALAENLLNWTNIGILLLCAPVVMVLSIRLSLKIGEYTAQKLGFTVP